MIGFKIGDEFLDIPPDTTIPVEWESGLFGDIIIAGLRTMPANPPFTEKNKRLLQYFNIISNNLKSVNIDCDLYLNNVFWIKGRINVAVKTERFECDWSEINELAESADKKLSEIFADDFFLLIDSFKRRWAITPSLTPGTTLELLFNIGVNTFNWQILTAGKTSTQLMDELFALMSANTDFMAVCDIRREFLGGQELIYWEVKHDNTIFQDSAATIQGVSLLFDTNQYGPYVDWTSFQQLAIRDYLNGNINNLFPSVNCCFPTIRNPMTYTEDNNPDFYNNSKTYNRYFNNYFLNNDLLPFRNSVSPQLFLFFILDRLAGVFNCQLKGNFKDISEFYNHCFVYSQRMADMVAGKTDSPFVFDPKPINIFKGYIKIGDYVPDVTLREFLTAIKNFFCLSITQRNNIITINTKKSVLQNPNEIDLTNCTFNKQFEIIGADITGVSINYQIDDSDEFIRSNYKELPAVIGPAVQSFSNLGKVGVKNNEVRLVIDEDAYYIAKIDTTSGSFAFVEWVFYSKNYYNISVADSNVVYDTKNTFTLNDDLVENIAGHVRKINVPHIFHQCNSSDFSKDTQPTQVRFMFYWGQKFGSQLAGGESFIFNGNADNLYPFASIDNFDMEGNKLGNYTLRIGGEEGVYDKLHKDWIMFLLNAKRFICFSLLTSNQIMGLNAEDKIRIGESLFLIEKIYYTTAGSEQSIPVKFYLRKIN